MHVLFIHSYFNAETAIVSSRSYRMCRALIEKGHEVTVLAQITDLNRAIFPSKGSLLRRVYLDGINVIGVNVPYSNKMSVMRRLLSFFLFMVISCIGAIRVKNVDIVFASSTPPTVAIPALLVKLFRRIPFVLELRDIWPDFVEQMNVIRWFPKWGFKVIDLCMRLIYRFANAVTTTTPGMTEIIRRKGVDAAKLGTILLGSDLESMSCSAAPHPVLARPELRGRFILCYIGSISFGYGLEQLIDIAQELQDRSARIGVLMVGHGARYEHMKNLMRERSLSNIAIHPSVEYRDVASILRHVQVGYESSIPTIASNPAFCNKFYDYMAAGLPILSNYDGDMGRFIRRNECGAVLKDVKKVADWLIDLASDSERYERMKSNAERLSHDVLDRKNEVIKFVNLVEAQAAGRLYTCEPPAEMITTESTI